MVVPRGKLFWMRWHYFVVQLPCPICRVSACDPSLSQNKETFIINATNLLPEGFSLATVYQKFIVSKVCFSSRSWLMTHESWPWRKTSRVMFSEDSELGINTRASLSVNIKDVWLILFSFHRPFSIQCKPCRSSSIEDQRLGEIAATSGTRATRRRQLQFFRQIIRQIGRQLCPNRFRFLPIFGWNQMDFQG